MRRLRTILLVRAVMAAFLVVVGLVSLAAGATFLGLFALVFGVTNAVLVVVLARREGAVPGGPGR